MGRTRVKICGLSEPAHVAAAAEAGAAYIGFVFFPKSPRAVTPEEARELAWPVPPGIAKVALVVNPTDAEIEAITATVPLDMIQLHGEETAERVAEIRVGTGLPVMKAIGGPDSRRCIPNRYLFGGRRPDPRRCAPAQG